MKIQSHILFYFYSDILEISDKELQTSLWLGKHPTCISSFTEVYCRLFDDNCFEHYIENGEFISVGFSNDFVEKLKQLALELNGYDEGNMEDYQIIEHEVWSQIRDFAASIILEWNELYPNLKGSPPDLSNLPF